jgi:hypothetical protein
VLLTPELDELEGNCSVLCICSETRCNARPECHVGVIYERQNHIRKTEGSKSSHELILIEIYTESNALCMDIFVGLF